MVCAAGDFTSPEVALAYAAMSGGKIFAEPVCRPGKSASLWTIVEVSDAKGIRNHKANMANKLVGCGLPALGSAKRSNPANIP